VFLAIESLSHDDENSSGETLGRSQTELPITAKEATPDAVIFIGVLFTAGVRNARGALAPPSSPSQTPPPLPSPHVATAVTVVVAATKSDCLFLDQTNPAIHWRLLFAPVSSPTPSSSAPPPAASPLETLRGWSVPMNGSDYAEFFNLSGGAMVYAPSLDRTVIKGTEPEREKEN